MAELLLELYSEEIPARMQFATIEAFKELLAESLKTQHIGFETIQGFISPRRIILIAYGIPLLLPGKVIEKKGPKVNSNESALQGFITSLGINRDDLFIKQIESNNYYFANIKIAEQSTADLLAQILPAMLAKFSWIKSMKWGHYQIKWIRPLINILCLFNNKILPFQYGHLNSNNITHGHRFMSYDTFEVHSVPQYLNDLEARYVKYNHHQRMLLIKQQCEQLCKTHHLTLIEDEKLLEEVTGLVEFPNALLGTIDKKYMLLPAEVIIASMKAHQKYFCLQKEGKLAPHFITIANVKTKNDEIVINGNQKVLAARLEDALFFLHKDLKVPLIQNLELLKYVTFHQKLGSMYDKVFRMLEIAKCFTEVIPCNKEILEKAVLLCKTDLVTDMVNEFPELQGIIGKYYALQQNELEEICIAIEEHYKPLGSDDTCPRNTLAIIISLADKFDSLLGLWLAQEKPTGSKDPFALRRAALSIIRILIENQVSLSLNMIIGRIINIYNNKIFDENNNTSNEIKHFFLNRLFVYMKSLGFRHDVVMAVTEHFDNIYLDYLKIVELNRFLETDEGSDLIKSYIRATNIVTLEEQKDNKTYNNKVETSLFVTPEEKFLYEKMDTINEQIKVSLTQHNYFQSFQLLRSLREPINNFFDKVIVNAPESDLRINRLNLLGQIKSFLDQVAAFSKLEI